MPHWDRLMFRRGAFYALFRSILHGKGNLVRSVKTWQAVEEIVSSNYL